MSFVGVSIMGIVDNITSPLFKAVSFEAAYVRFIEAVEVMMKQEDVLQLLFDTRRDESLLKALNVTSHDDL